MRAPGNGSDGMDETLATAEGRFEIVNRLGLHARAAAKLVRLANRFGSEIRLAREELEVNGKSIMGVLMLAAACHSFVTVRAEGQDAREAVDAIAALIADKFEEDE